MCVLCVVSVWFLCGFCVVCVLFVCVFVQSEMYSCAEELGIPHLWDSTPAWCDRVCDALMLGCNP